MIDGGQQRLHGAERERQRHLAQREAGSLRGLLEDRAGRREHSGLRTLEAVDRLLFVADREDGARLGRSTGDGKKFGCERLNHAPLRRARILRFVDEDVIEATIEFQQNPGGGISGREKIGGAIDEIVEIQRGGEALGVDVVLHDGIGEPHQGERGFRDLQALVLGEQFRDLVPRAGKLREDIGMRFLDGFTDEGVGAGLELRGKQRLLQ